LFFKNEKCSEQNSLRFAFARFWGHLLTVLLGANRNTLLKNDDKIKRLKNIDRHGP
jgi:hypothetical protein